MNIFRIIGAIIGLVGGFLYLLFAYVMLGWGSSDSPAGHWSHSQRLFAIIPWSVPFLFTFWIVYRCFRTEEMEYWEILSLEVRPKALVRALLAEMAALMVGWLVIFMIVKQGIANELSSRVLLEEHTPLIEIRDSGRRPSLPLSQDAVGIEAPNGKFTPVMFLTWPQAGWNFQEFAYDLKTEAPRFKIYRGTNEIAVSNHFLGEFQIGGYSKTKTSLTGTVFFMLSQPKQLFVQAKAENKANLELKRVGTGTKE
jgi:hypothetical protein